MIGTLKTLLAGSSARAEERLRDTYAIELIEQKIRESQASLDAAKATLASLIQRHKAEVRTLKSLDGRIEDLTSRAEIALADDNEAIALQAADAIAQMENEKDARQETIDRLDQRILQLRHSVETAHRRIIDLKQGAISARAVRFEQNVQSKLNKTISSTSSAQEAEEMIAQVLGKEDPFEQSEILAGIERDLSHENLADRMAEQGYGSSTRTTGADVLNRLKSKK